MKKHPSINPLPAGTPVPDGELKVKYDKRAKKFRIEISETHYYDSCYAVICEIEPGRHVLGNYNVIPDTWYYTEFGSVEVLNFHSKPVKWYGIADEFTGEDTGDPDYHRKRMEQKYYTHNDVRKMVDEWFELIKMVDEWFELIKMADESLEFLPNVKKNALKKGMLLTGALWMNDEYKKMRS